MNKVKYMAVMGLLFGLVAVGCAKTEPNMPESTNSGVRTETDGEPRPASPQTQYATVNFSDHSQIYNFRGEIPLGWKVSYIPELESINIYDSGTPVGSEVDQSLIFIRHFKANSFLTLSTVNIISRESTTVNGHEAVRYEIEKKPGVPNFPGQPLWRNARHKLIDIRASGSNPSEFYVIAHSPKLDSAGFENFVNSLQFPVE